MSCQRAQELIHGYVDGELDGLQTTEVERHIDQCDDCKLDYRSQITLRSSLKDTSLYHRAPTNLKRRIRTSLQKEAREDVTQRTFSWRWAVAGALLAVLLVIGTVWKVVPLFMHPPIEELLAQEIVADHIRSLQLPDHLTDVVSSDQHTVKPWFSGKVDFSPPVRDFADQGFSLCGGRLEYLNKRTVAALVYQRRLHYINLYIWPAVQAPSGGGATTRLQGYNLVHWTTSGLTFWAISDLNNVELHDFARLVQQAE